MNDMDVLNLMTDFFDLAFSAPDMDRAHKALAEVLALAMDTRTPIEEVEACAEAALQRYVDGTSFGDKWRKEMNG
jgi:hypothetical protein